MDAIDLAVVAKPYTEPTLPTGIAGTFIPKPGMGPQSPRPLNIHAAPPPDEIAQTPSSAEEMWKAMENSQPNAADTLNLEAALGTPMGSVFKRISALAAEYPEMKEWSDMLAKNIKAVLDGQAEPTPPEA